MNKKILLILGILVLVLLGAGVFFLSKLGSTQNQPELIQNQKTPSTAQSNTGNKSGPIETTLKSLLSMGKSLKCSFSNNTKDASVSGTVYAGSGKVRQDFQTNAAGIATSGHVIVDSSTMYMWTDTSNQGFKFALDQVSSPSSGSAQSQTPDINKAMNFSCKGWSIDNSFFVLPSKVTFQSFTVPSASQSGGTTGGSGVGAPKSACAACDNLPAGEARNACRTQLKCQ